MRGSDFVKPEIERHYKSPLDMRFSHSSALLFKRVMFKQLCSFGQLCCRKKTNHTFAILWVCVLLCSLSSSSASSEFGRRGAFFSFVFGGDKETSTPSNVDVTDNENSLCPRVEGSPGRFPYLCSLRMPGSRKHVCSATLVDKRWVVTAAHCIDPNFENSVGCYPIVYCGINQIDTTSAKKRFHVEDAYIHKRWTGDINKGADIAMLKLDKAAKLETPRLFREGMVYGKDTELLTPGWGIGEDKSEVCGIQSYLPARYLSQDKCPKKLTTVSKDSWLCFCRDDVNERKGLEGGPLVLADQPCKGVDKGYPSEDLIVGVASFDPDSPTCGKCYIYPSIAYYRDWIVNTIAGRTAPSQCTLKPKCSKLPTPAYPKGCEAPPESPKETEPKTTLSPSPSPPMRVTESAPPLTTPDYPPDQLYNFMIMALMQDKYETVLWVLQNGLPPDTPLNKKELDVDVALVVDATLLYWATIYEATQSIEVLVNNGAHVNAVDSNGRTAVHIAVIKNIVKSLTTLIKVNAALDISDNNGLTPLHEAVVNGYFQITEVLVRRGADINASGGGKTALEMAWELDDTNIVAFLVENGADVTSFSGGEVLLHDAVLKGYIDVIMALINSGADLNIVHDGKTALYIAIETGHKEIVEALINANADITIPSATGWTLLHLAVEKKDIEITKWLIDRGADVNARVNNQTPLSIALDMGYSEIVMVLIEAHADIESFINDKEETPLHVAAEKGYIDTVKALIKSKANVNAITVDHKTPLYLAVQKGYVEIIQILIAAHADLNIIDAHEKTALHIAVENGNTEIALILISAKTNVDLADSEKMTALHLAAKGEYTEIVQALLEAGANPNLQNKDGYSALHFAAKSRVDKLVEILLYYGADRALTTNSKETALHLAARVGKRDIILALIGKGAELELSDEKGRSPLCVAVSLNVYDAVEVLVDKGANKEFVVGPNGETPIMLAAKSGYDEIIKLLIKKGANVVAQDRNGNTALHVAAAYAQRKACQALLDNTAKDKRLKDIENNAEHIPFDVICLEVDTDTCSDGVREDLEELLEMAAFSPY